MKNIVLLFLTLLTLVPLSACKRIPPVEESQSANPSLLESSSILESSSDEMSENTQSGTSIPTDPETGLPIYIPGSIKLYPYDEDIYPNGKPYRDCWYISSGMFELGQTWEEHQYFVDHVERDPERMLLVQYIEYFNIPKEVFVAELERVRKFYESFVSDMSIEEIELPNADIIYTFDDEIINHYYRYE
ncbi:MAG TPA: hypothetical protein DD733_07070 [Clostridiales bacterium]|nr:hypothetical protein [Eubacteriales bacterium]HBR31830.1 hypothetical protein [Clostridiales bacterium]